MINGKVEEKTCGEGPSLNNMFDDDYHLRDVINNIKGCLYQGFNAADKYSASFEVYQLFYAENEAMDLDAVRNEEHGNEKSIHLLISLLF